MAAMRAFLCCCLCMVVNASEMRGDNEPDPLVNLALLPSAELSGSVQAGQGRGLPSHILFDPRKNDYVHRSDHAEYGVSAGYNMGRPDAGDGFRWQVAWPQPKYINAFTIGGTYPNQPQPHTAWRISYRQGRDWHVLDEGTGGWIDAGIFSWGGASTEPIVADALRVQVYSDGAHDLVSIHLRGRGGRATRTDDRGSDIKACLIQFLPGSGAATAVQPVVSGRPALEQPSGPESPAKGAPSAPLPLVVHMPFYRELWFLLLCCGVLVGTVLWVVYMLTRRDSEVLAKLHRQEQRKGRRHGP